ncbi:hypothetical protein Taro_013189 [Colocasia esculenta]|uniref:Uncharacterized protein n=1 Tax=Colocasia esculenta TaxID=4460 RepID=A0A843U5Z0_COLES|nr:hypothetical protein [Colocasia esculenta]
MANFEKKEGNPKRPRSKFRDKQRSRSALSLSPPSGCEPTCPPLAGSCRRQQQLRRPGNCRPHQTARPQFVGDRRKRGQWQQPAKNTTKKWGYPWEAQERGDEGEVLHCRWKFSPPASVFSPCSERFLLWSPFYTLDARIGGICRWVMFTWGRSGPDALFPLVVSAFVLKSGERRRKEGSFNGSECPSLELFARLGYCWKGEQMLRHFARQVRLATVVATWSCLTAHFWAVEEEVGDSPLSQNALEKVASVVLDIDNLTQPSEKCSGSPKMTKALSRKGSCRMERRGNEEQEADDASKKFVVKVVSSQLDLSKQPSITSKALVTVNSTVNSPSLADAGDGRNKRFSRLSTIHPRKILLLFATICLFKQQLTCITAPVSEVLLMSSAAALVFESSAAPEH